MTTTPTAFGAIVATLRVGIVAFEAQVNAKVERLIWIDNRWVDNSQRCVERANRIAT
jgi:hypothetical protein